MEVSGLPRAAAVLGAAATAFGFASSAWAVTPGWECIPTTASQPVLSGGTGSAPSCGAGTTAVLAPTYVSSGVGGKPTVQFAAVNVQILNGAGSTASVNGEGNLVVGYDETPGTQSGSHDLVLGQHQAFTSFGDLVGGYANSVSAGYAAVFGESNKAAGSYSFAAGDANQAAANAGSVLGGFKNVVKTPFSAIAGGCNNLVGIGTVPSTPSACTDPSGHAGDFASITGGVSNQASGIASSVTGGWLDAAGGEASWAGGGNQNTASGWQSAVLGGFGNRATFPSGGNGTSGNANMTTVGGHTNTATGDTSVVSGGYNNAAQGGQSSVSGGEFNLARDSYASVAGGCDNLAGSGTYTGFLCDPNGAQTVLGGNANAANGLFSTIGGGADNVAGGNQSSVEGGYTNTAAGVDSSILTGEFNLATGLGSGITGGCDNLAGAGTQPTSSCNGSGLQTVTGGQGNNAANTEDVVGGAAGYHAHAGTVGIGNGSPPSNTTVMITSVQVPAGHYAIQAHVVLANDDNAPEFDSCFLKANSTDLDGAAEDFPSAGSSFDGEGWVTNLPLVDVRSFSSGPNTIAVYCEGYDAEADNTNLDVEQLGTAP